MNGPALPFLLAIPLFGAIATALLPATFAKTWALLVSLATAVMAFAIALKFDYSSGAVQFAFNPDPHGLLSLEAIRSSFTLGITSIGLYLILLTVLLMPLAILSSFDAIKDRPKEYYAWLLGLMVAMMGVFVSRDVLLFYVFFELTLVPMFFIIGIWGGPERRKAAAKFFLFTFAGSVFTLAAITYLGMSAETFNLDQVITYAQINMSDTARWWVLLGLLAGFAVKVPLFPVHTWLPLAHTEAPTAGSVILAGVLLKLGTFGLLQVALPIGLVGPNGAIFPTLVQTIGALCVIGIIYGALVAWVQQDIKKLVAYSSVSHLGFCVLGLMAFNPIGLQGSVLYMINHGLSTGAMFLCIGMIYDRYHTRDIKQLSGLAKIMPKLAFFFIFFTMSSIGLPGLNGFWSEFLTILGAFTSKQLGIWYGVFAATGVVLGAIYMLHMAACVIWGPLKVPGHDDTHGHTDHEDHATASTDINAREMTILIPLALVVIFLGVCPAPMMRSILAPVEAIRLPTPEAAAVYKSRDAALAQSPVRRDRSERVADTVSTEKPTLAPLAAKRDL